ncbi:bactericidal permeability-increasing protein-like isoform 2-T2 [Morus bassanus]
MGVQSLAVACGVLALCLALTGATNPGFVVRITQAGLDYAHQQGIAVLEKELAQLKLPDISGDFRIRHVGKVRYEISRLNLRSFHMPYSRITLVPNVGLQVAISNAFAEVDGNWRVKIYFIRDHGLFDLKVENIYIKINLKLGSDASGKPTIDTSDCSTRISNVRVLFSGKFGWLYNLFHNAIESRFRKILENQVCRNVVNSVHSELQPYLQTLPVTARIDAMAGTAGIDYSLVAPPTVTAQSLDVNLKGEFFSLAHRSTVPFPPLVLTLPPDHDRMVYFGASSYFFNTAGFAYHAAGVLVFEITDSMIPKGVEFHLNTSTFSAFVPQHRTRRALTQACRGYPGLRHPSRLQPGSSLPPQPDRQCVRRHQHEIQPHSWKPECGQDEALSEAFGCWPFPGANAAVHNEHSCFQYPAPAS